MNMIFSMNKMKSGYAGDPIADIKIPRWANQNFMKRNILACTQEIVYFVSHLHEIIPIYI